MRQWDALDYADEAGADILIDGLKRPLFSPANQSRRPRHCDLTDAERLEMEATLEAEIDASEDQILIVDLGPSDSRRYHVRAIGRPTSTEKGGADQIVEKGRLAIASSSESI